MGVALGTFSAQMLAVWVFHLDMAISLGLFYLLLVLALLAAGLAYCQIHVLYLVGGISSLCSGIVAYWWLYYSELEKSPNFPCIFWATLSYLLLWGNVVPCQPFNFNFNFNDYDYVFHFRAIDFPPDYRPRLFRGPHHLRGPERILWFPLQ